MAPQLTATLVQDNHNFVTHATFKLFGLGAFLADGSPVVRGQLKFTLGRVGPGLNVIATVENKQVDGPKYNTIEFSLALDSATPQDSLPVFATFELLSYAGATINVNRLTAFRLMGTGPQVYWPDALSPVHWRNFECMQQDDGVLLQVFLRSQQGPSAPSPAVATILHKTIHNTEKPDVRFTVFNRRYANGRLGERRILLADGKTLQTSSRIWSRAFSNQPDGEWNGFRVGHPSNDDPSATYEDPDSDFERDDGDEKMPADGSDPQDGGVTSEPAAKRIRVKQETQDGSKDTAEGASNEVPRIKREREDDSHLPPVSGRAESIDAVEVSSERNMLDIVVLGASSASWEALLFYTYAAIIEFAPLSSSGALQRRTYIENYAQRMPHRPKPCSPKSMYRLAGEMRWGSLQKMCLGAISAQLTTANIIPEILSSFTAKYEEVKEVEIDYLVQHWEVLRDSDEFKTAMREVAKGTYPHAGDLLAEIFHAVGNSKD